MLGLSRLEAEILGALALVAAFVLWLGFHDHEVKEAATAPIIAQVQAVAEAASAAQAASAAATAASQSAALKEAHEQATIAQARADDLAGVVRRMRDDTLRRHPAAPDPTASAGGDAGVSPRSDLVWRRLLESAYAEADDSASDAADLAGTVAALRVSGGLCRKDYESLR